MADPGEDESESGESMCLLDGLKSWLGFAGAMLGADSGVMRRSVRRKTLFEHPE